MQEAVFYEKKEDGKVKCTLCPWYCELKPGDTGSCKVRRNTGGILETLVFGKVAAIAIDPIEKKPLYHFFPGKNILSIGLVGCNLHCTFCQNHTISQCQADEFQGFVPFTASQLLEKAKEVNNNIGIAYTYNEPFTFFELMFETAQLIHAHAMKNVVVSNGFVNPVPLKTILPFTDAFNIDLKAYDERFYRKQAKGRLKPVLKTIVAVAESKVHLEITNLVIPGQNDNETQFENMVKWIARETGINTPLHLSRYFPHYKLHEPATSLEKLERLYYLAKTHLQYVYVGNVNNNGRAATSCPGCGKVLIQRNRNTVIINSKFTGYCPDCGKKIQLII